MTGLTGEFSMKKTFLLKETRRIRKIMNEGYDLLLATFKKTKKKEKSLEGDYRKLHDIWPLLKTGQIQIEYFNDDGTGRYIGLTIKED
jgi:hypothetical protein